MIRIYKCGLWLCYSDISFPSKDSLRSV